MIHFAKRPKTSQRGETLVEVIMALGILSFLIISSYALATSTFRMGRSAGQRTQAVAYLQEQAEALRWYRDNISWSTATPSFTSSTNYNGAPTYFCMKPTTSNSVTTWAPVSTTTASPDPACIKDNITIAIKRSTPGTVIVAGKEFVFDMTATWSVSGQANIVTLQTRLTSQE